MCITNAGLEALTTNEELNEVRVVGVSHHVVKLKRTFNQKLLDGSVIRFWRVMSPPSHRNYQSDLSYQGLIDWGII